MHEKQEARLGQDCSQLTWHQGGRPKGSCSVPGEIALVEPDGCSASEGSVSGRGILPQTDRICI
jgi:hypothetical protein